VTINKYYIYRYIFRTFSVELTKKTLYILLEEFIALYNFNIIQSMIRQEKNIWVLSKLPNKPSNRLRQPITAFFPAKNWRLNSGPPKKILKQSSICFSHDASNTLNLKFQNFPPVKGSFDSSGH
jgi:hypothetical protein